MPCIDLHFSHTHTHTLYLSLYYTHYICIIFNLIVFFPRHLISLISSFHSHNNLFGFFLLCVPETKKRTSVASVRPESIPQFSNMANGKIRLLIDCISFDWCWLISKSVKVQARFVANFLLFCKVYCPLTAHNVMQL